MPSTTDMPAPTKCEFCGKTLDVMTVELCGIEMFCGWKPCDCADAVAEQEREKAKEAARQTSAKMAAFEGAIIGAGIPPRYRHATHPWAEKLANRIREGKGFYLHGENGCGKTLLACAAAIKCIEAGMDVRFWVSTKLLDELSDYSRNSKELLRDLERCDLLVVDDLGKEGAATPRAAEKLFDLFNDRYNATTEHVKKPVLITSNFQRGDVASRVSNGGVGIAVASRLASMTKSVLVPGGDRRLHDE